MKVCDQCQECGDDVFSHGTVCGFALRLALRALASWRGRCFASPPPGAAASLRADVEVNTRLGHCAGPTSHRPRGCSG